MENIRPNLLNRCRVSLEYQRWLAERFIVA